MRHKPFLEIAACNNQNCAAIWVSETPISTQFVYSWLLFRYEQTRQLGSGNNQPAMNKSIVEQIEFPLPPLAEQETIVAAAEGQLSVIDHLEADLDAESDRAERERKLDQALELTFPASEPIAVGRPTGTELATFRRKNSEPSLLASVACRGGSCKIGRFCR